MGLDFEVLFLANVIIVIEANYSTALMLLLKYPAPSHPYGPQTFVDDAVYLRNNFSAAGGAHIITKYSGQSPSTHSPDLRPSTPLGQALSPRQRFSRTKSPIPSPARFLQQQGGVEALFQGAAKGVFDRGERLGINQAVRDAVGEVKKNMQGLQASRANSIPSRTTSDVMRWSLDEGQPVTPSRNLITAMNKRNEQLARMLDQAMADLRAVSVSTEGDKEKYTNAIDLAIAKVDFVKVYLEDSTMPLPTEFITPSASPLIPGSSPTLVAHKNPELSRPSPLVPELEAKSKLGRKQLPGTPRLEDLRAASAVSTERPRAETPSPPVTPSESEAKANPLRPKAPVPTRSTIANSSFAWMLDADSLASGGLSIKTASPQSTSPFLKSGRKPTSGASREKAAFLFGEDGGESQMSNSRSPLLTEPEEGFDLKTMQTNTKDQ